MMHFRDCVLAESSFMAKLLFLPLLDATLAQLVIAWFMFAFSITCTSMIFNINFVSDMYRHYH